MARTAEHSSRGSGQETSIASSTRALSRGLDVLGEILEAGTPLTLTELVTLTGLAKTTTSRLLATLTECGYVAQQPNGSAYLPGPLVARWLRTGPLESLLAEQGAPVLEAVREASGETAVLCVPTWPDRVCIARSLSRSPVRSHKRIGDSGPLTRGCTGRAFLAFATDAHIRTALKARPLIGTTRASVTDEDEFAGLLRVERDQGYCISVEGTHLQMSGVAVPIFAPASTMPVAVINVSGPTARWTRRNMEGFAPALQEWAATISSYFSAQSAS
jgi:DNA-binding IclR family transcriptional regulator